MPRVWKIVTTVQSHGFNFSPNTFIRLSTCSTSFFLFFFLFIFPPRRSLRYAISEQLQRDQEARLKGHEATDDGRGMIGSSDARTYVKRWRRGVSKGCERLSAERKGPYRQDDVSSCNHESVRG